MRGLCRGLGSPDGVCSPTYTTENIYPGGRLTVYHFDLYRVESEEDLLTCGFFDALEGDGITVAEWSERLAALPGNAWNVTITQTGDEERVIMVDGGGER